MRNRVLHRPIQDFIELPTRMPRAEVWPDAFIRRLESDQSHVALAHQI